MRDSELKLLWSSFVEPKHVEWTWRVLEALYGEPHRAYHNLSHVAACLDFVSEARRHEVFMQPLVELALLWHDAVYVPGDKRNEELSAELLRSFESLIRLHGSWEASCAAILATKNHETVADNMVSRVTIDIDLSILGAGPGTYSRYVRDIRKEYSSVSDEAWRNGRAGFLRQMLARERIFQTDWGQRFDSPARHNMLHELAALEKKEKK